MTDSTEVFSGIVCQYYDALFRFAMSLTGAEFDAEDLTQQTFYIWATKGHQLRDATKVKAWLFTTLHRMFLVTRRRQNKFTHQELDENQLPASTVEPEAWQPDCSQVLVALAKVDEVHQSAVALYYLEDFSYKNIAEILNVPVGTVKSRIARGIAQLRQLLIVENESESNCPCGYVESWRMEQRQPAKDQLYCPCSN
jgi:RNA polymerase sigma-70 factor (ECF subfamily)